MGMIGKNFNKFDLADSNSTLSDFGIKTGRIDPEKIIVHQISS